jgi:hypothetical protein
VAEGAQRETEVAQVLRELALKLPGDERDALRRLLENSIADPPAAIDRNRAFGLLMRMVRADGVIPTEPEVSRLVLAEIPPIARHDWHVVRMTYRRLGIICAKGLLVTLVSSVALGVNVGLPCGLWMCMAVGREWQPRKP